jgi:hypothetical protein
MTGVSAHERDLREHLIEERAAPDWSELPVKMGVLRGILADLDMWRRLADNEQALREVEKKPPGGSVPGGQRVFVCDYCGARYPEARVKWVQT